MVYPARLKSIGVAVAPVPVPSIFLPIFYSAMAIRSKAGDLTIQRRKRSVEPVMSRDFGARGIHLARNIHPQVFHQSGRQGRHDQKRCDDDADMHFNIPTAGREAMATGAPPLSPWSGRFCRVLAFGLR